MPDQPASPLRVILLDDHTWVHQAATDLIALTDDVLLVGQGTDGTQALPLFESHRPHVVLMDIVMPQMDGIIATRDLLARYPDARVLALSSFQDERSVYDMLRAGATGYILKTYLSEELIPTLRTVHSGGAVLSAPVAALLAASKTRTSDDPPTVDFKLTERELDVLRALAKGETNAAVAQSLTISTATVRFHITNITEKMGVNTRTVAIVLAVRHKLI